MRFPDGGSIFQLRAYKCIVGSLSDSYILVLMFLFIKPKVLFALDVMRSMCLAQETTTRHDHTVCMKILKFS